MREIGGKENNVDKVTTELYQALYEIMDSARKLKTYAGTACSLAEKQIVEMNHRFIEERGKEAMTLYEDARKQEESTANEHIAH